jgi:hypothetical protein
MTTEKQLEEIKQLLAAEEAKTPRAGGVHALRRAAALLVVAFIVLLVLALRH